MKKIALIALLAISVIACKEKKESKETTPIGAYELNAETSIVNWIGYKFTNKTGVKGQFKTLNITHQEKGASIKEALQNAAFSIPVSSIFSNNELRDGKLKTLFFGVMKNTELLTGKVTSVGDKDGMIILKMNDEAHELPFTYKTQGNTAYLTATVDLTIWNALEAWESIHKACELLHTGEDGKSVTWKQVDLDIALNFDKQ